MPSPRDDLHALVDAASDEMFADLRALPVDGNARAAAVLILFGTLDAVPAVHAAASVPADLDVLLLSRADTLRAHPGQIAFPGGRVDPGDAGPVAAALREAQEETGLDPAGVSVIGTLPRVPLAYSRHLVTPVVAWWERPTPVRPVDVAESTAVFRAPVADLVDPARRAITRIHRDGRTWSGPAFLVPHASGVHVVWGFTAMLLDGMFDRLGWSEPWDATREIALPIPAPARAAVPPRATRT